MLLRFDYQSNGSFPHPMIRDAGQSTLPIIIYYRRHCTTHDVVPIVVTMDVSTVMMMERIFLRMICLLFMI